MPEVLTLPRLDPETPGARPARGDELPVEMQLRPGGGIAFALAHPRRIRPRADLEPAPESELSPV